LTRLQSPLAQAKPHICYVSFVDIDRDGTREVDLSGADLHLEKSHVSTLPPTFANILTPLVLIQQIVMEEQATLLAGPQTREAPLPEEQYGAPDVQTF